MSVIIISALVFINNAQILKVLSIVGAKVDIKWKMRLVQVLLLFVKDIFRMIDIFKMFDIYRMFDIFRMFDT